MGGYQISQKGFRVRIKNTDLLNTLTPGQAVSVKTRRQGNFRAWAAYAVPIASTGNAAGMVGPLSEHPLKVAGIMGLQQLRLAR